jgi:undecaprenyl phosphate-alpha-L-ara4FN deformylase
MLNGKRSTCPQLPTTLPTFDELLGRDGIEESTIAEALFKTSERNAATSAHKLQVFTLHAELEGMLLLNAFEELLRKWQAAGVALTRMARVHELALQIPLPDQTVLRGEVPGRSGLLAIQPPNAEAA